AAPRSAGRLTVASRCPPVTVTEGVPFPEPRRLQPTPAPALRAILRAAAGARGGRPPGGRRTTAAPRLCVRSRRARSLPYLIVVSMLRQKHCHSHHGRYAPRRAGSPRVRVRVCPPLRRAD